MLGVLALTSCLAGKAAAELATFPAGFAHQCERGGGHQRRSLGDGTTAGSDDFADPRLLGSTGLAWTWRKARNVHAQLRHFTAPPRAAATPATAWSPPTSARRPSRHNPSP